MKLSNIFKKSTKTVAAINVQKLDKNQLDKVVGGASTEPISTSERTGTDKRTYTGGR